MKAGERYIVTTGEYSDYGIRDSFIVKRTFSFDLALERWLKEYGDDGSFGYAGGQSEQDFLAWLRSEGFVEDEKLNEVHLANYSQPEPAPAKDAADDSRQSAEQ